VDILEVIADGALSEDEMAGLIRNAFRRPPPADSEAGPAHHWETERLAGYTWEGLLDAHERVLSLTGSDLRFLSLGFLAYFLPAYLLLSLGPEAEDDSDLPLDVEMLLAPGNEFFRTGLKDNLLPDERNAVQEFVRHRAALLVSRFGPPSEWDNLPPAVSERPPDFAEWLRKVFSGYERAYEWWSRDDGV
jgi:hypothetical protein